MQVEKGDTTVVIVYVHLLEESAPLSLAKQYSTLCQPATAHSRHLAKDSGVHCTRR